MNQESKKEITIDDLALMVAKGFNDINERMDKGFDGVDNKIDELKNELKVEMAETRRNLKAELNKKIDVFSHKDLEFRVEKLEEKVIAA